MSYKSSRVGTSESRLQLAKFRNMRLVISRAILLRKSACADNASLEELKINSPFEVYMLDSTAEAINTETKMAG